MSGIDTTHEKKKTEMLGRVPANNGAVALRDESRKELCIA
jgi:hypothetical protein